MKGLKWLDRHFEESLLCLLLLVMFVIMMIQIVLRAMGNSLPWAEELTRDCLIFSGFLSLGYTIQKNTILKVDIITGLFPQRIQKVLGVLLLLVTGLTFGYLFYESIGLVQVIKGTNQISSALRFPIYLLYVTTVIGFFFGTLRCIQGMIQMIRGFFRQDDGAQTEGGEPV